MECTVIGDVKGHYVRAVTLHFKDLINVYSFIMMEVGITIERHIVNKTPISQTDGQH